MSNVESRLLIHSGVKGMKWRVRRRSEYLNKGNTVHHISKNKDVTISNDRLFLSYKIKDIQRYQYVVGKMWVTRTLYDHSYKLKDAIKTPSKKEQDKIFDDLTRSHPDIKERLENFIGEKIPKSEDIHLVYNELIGYKNPPFINEYKDIAKKRGYNAIIDYNDKGRNAESPIIVLDAKHSLSKIKVKQLNPKDIAIGKKFVDELRKEVTR